LIPHKVFLAYLRGIETHLGQLSQIWEGWFLAYLRGIETKEWPEGLTRKATVFSLPKRDWNFCGHDARSGGGMYVFSLPKRDWNALRSGMCYKLRTRFLAYLRGIETWFAGTSLNMESTVFSLPKRDWNISWSHNGMANGVFEFLAYLRGIETRMPSSIARTFITFLAYLRGIETGAMPATSSGAQCF